MSLRRIKSQKGFSLVESMIGGAVISVTALALGSAMHSLKKNREKSELISLTVGIESALVATLQDASSYPSSVIDQLDNTDRILPSVSFNVAGNPPFQVISGRTQYFTKEMRSCDGFSDTCVIKIMLSNLRKFGPEYKFAYGIETNQSVVAMAPLGSRNPASASESEHSVTIPKEIYQKKEAASCDPEISIAMMGVNEQGSAICLNKPRAADACPANGSLAVGYQVKQDASGNFYLAFKCLEPLKNVRCQDPANTPYPGGYAIQHLSPTGMDQARSPDRTGVGTCVFIAKAQTDLSAPAQFRDGVQVRDACPAGYNIEYSCEMVAPNGNSAVCASGVVIAPTLPTRAIASVDQTSKVINCMVEVPPQRHCSGDPSRVSQAWADARVRYRCILDTAMVPETVPAGYQ